MNEGNAWLADSSIECNSQPTLGACILRRASRTQGAELTWRCRTKLPWPSPKTLICFLAFSRGVSLNYFLCCDVGTALLESLARCFLDRAFSTAPSSGGATGHQATLVLLAAKTLFPGVARVKKSKWQNQTQCCCETAPSLWCPTTVARPPVAKMCCQAPAGAAGLCSATESTSKSELRNDHQTISSRLPVVSCCVMNAVL